MATHFQMAVRSRIGECQNIGVVNSFEGKERWGGGFQIQTKSLIRLVTCKMC